MLCNYNQQDDKSNNDEIDVSNDLASNEQAEDDLHEKVLELSQSMKRYLSLQFERNFASMSSI